MTPEQLAETVVAAVAAAVGAGELAVAVPETVTVERPKDRGHGDYATNVALRLAKEAGRPPRVVAELLATRLKTAGGVASVEIADPGFLNIRLAVGAAGDLARAVVTAGSAYGRSDALAGRRIDLEVVSADPTEPLPLGHIRRAVVGDALARILAAAGATVTRTQSVKLAKRTGTLITLDGLIDQIGPDAARYALVRSAPDHDLVLDIDVLTRHTSDNPLWTVQYAHAWTSSILRYAADLGLDLGSGGQFRPELLVHPREETLLAALAEYPRVVAQAAELREVHKVAHQLETVSKAHHAWQSERKDCRVLPQGGAPSTDVNRARLWLVAATRIVLANGLELLGVSAPERM